MKVFHEIILDREQIDSSMWRKLIAIYPDGQRFSIFWIKLLEGDPVLSDIIAVLQSNRIVECRSDRGRERNTYSHKRFRAYDVADFDAASFLKLNHIVMVQEEQKRDSEGRLEIEAWRLMPEVKMGCVLRQATVVSDTVRLAMEADGLVGVRFQELVLRPPYRQFVLMGTGGNAIRGMNIEHSENNGRFWELKSSIVLPPLEKSLLFCLGGEPFSGDYSKVINIRDELVPPELHYPMRSLGSFDFATTFEGLPYEPWLVVSQRFRQFCIRNELKADWHVVRLDT